MPHYAGQYDKSHMLLCLPQTQVFMDNQRSMMYGREPRFPLEAERKGLDNNADIDEAIYSMAILIL